MSNNEILQSLIMLWTFKYICQIDVANRFKFLKFMHVYQAMVCNKYVTMHSFTSDRYKFLHALMDGSIFTSLTTLLAGFRHANGK